MNFRKIIPAALAVVVFLFLTDYLWYGMLDMMTPSPDQLETPRFPFLVLSYLILGFFFVYYYMTSHGDGSKAAEGFKQGAFLGLFVFGVGGFMWFSLSKSGILSETLIDIVFHIIQCGIAGIIVAYITGLPGAGDRDGVKGSTSGGATPPPPPAPVGTPD